MKHEIIELYYWPKEDSNAKKKSKYPYRDEKTGIWITEPVFLIGE